MARFLKDRIKTKGQAPGTLVFIGNRKMDAPLIQVIEYNSEYLEEKECSTIEDAYKNIKPSCVTWINVYGLHDLELIRKIGEVFSIPLLILEDIVNTDQRPKYEEAENHDIFFLKMLRQEEKDSRVHAEQISIILGENYLLTLQEKRGDVFTPVRERIRKNKGTLRLRGNDYLAYALMDTIVDNYTYLIERIGGQVEDLEDRLFSRKDSTIVEEIYAYKTELNYLRKSVRPVKELMLSLLKTENSFFKESNSHYLNDLYDLVTQSTDAIELYNNLVADQLNIYNTNASNRLNEVMKVLTIFASIFIPLTFIAGVYGMNFKYIPELEYQYSYPIFWGVVIATIIILFIFFKRRKWL